MMQRSLATVFALAALLTSSVVAGEWNRTYECVPVNTAFVAVMHRSVTSKKHDSGSPDKVKYSPTSFAVGYMRASDRLDYGAAFNFEAGNRRIDYGDGDKYKVRTNIPGVSAFATYRPDANGTYVSASAFLGFARYKAKSPRVGGVSIGGTDKENRTLFALGLEAGREFTFSNGFFLTPHLGVDYAHAPSERYRFIGRGDTIDSQSYWEFPVGVTLGKTFNCGEWSFTPKADFTLVPSAGKIDPKNSHPGFAYRVADRWKVAGASAGGHLGGRITTGIEARLRDRMSLGVDYTYEGRSKYNDHRIGATFGLSF